jgi:hypothetical protein
VVLSIQRYMYVVNLIVSAMAMSQRESTRPCRDMPIPILKNAF